MQNSKLFPGQYPEPPFRGEESLFSFSKNVPKLSYNVTAMQNSKIFRGTKTFISRRVVFVLQKCTETLLRTAMQNSKIFRGTKPRTFISRGGGLVFVLQKCTETFPQQCRIRKFSRGQYPRFKVNESLFSFSENVLENSCSNAEFKNFPGDNTPNLRFRGEENLFSFSENVPKLSYGYAEFLKKSGGRTLDPGLREWEVKVASS